MREPSSRSNRLAVCGAAVIGLAAAQALLASQAEALPGLQRITRTSVADSSTSKTVTARCPVGKRVLGGGGMVTGGGGQVVLQRLEPVQAPTDDRFVVGAREDGTGFTGNWRLTAYALCANPLAGYAILPSTSGSATSNTPQNTLSFCIGQPQVGYGGRVDAGAGQVHLSNLAGVSNAGVDLTLIAGLEDSDGFAGAWTVTAYTVCASGPINLTPVSATAPASSVNKSATVTCPAGTRVHSAGAQLTQPGSSQVSPALIVDKIAIDPELRRVTARAVEDETGTATSWSVRAFALCGL